MNEIDTEAAKTALENMARELGYEIHNIVIKKIQAELPALGVKVSDGIYTGEKLGG